MRCARTCSADLLPLPSSIEDKVKNQPLSPKEKHALTCPRCRGLTRPHVLWFDEFYDEDYYRADSAVRWASQSDLLLVIGTAGATTLPMRIGTIVSRNPGAILIDVNPNPNPFQGLARSHPKGVVLQGQSGDVLPKLVDLWERSS
jgi:NAD-dependent deacetylase